MTMVDIAILLTVAGAVALFWMLFPRTDGDGRATIVGVQRHGRTYFVRRDQLDRWNDDRDASKHAADRTPANLLLGFGLLVVGTLALLSLTRLA